MMRVLTRNIGWKVLALGASLALWYLVAGEAEVAASVPTVVQYRNTPQDLEISSEHPERLFLKLKGPASRLTATALAETALMLDLSAVNEPGERTFTVTEENLGLPPGVKLIRVVPSQVRLTFDKVASRYVPIEVRYAGPPVRGYRIASQVVSPSAVRVSGPASRLPQIDSVSTDAIDLSSTIGKAEFRVPVFVGDPQLRFDPPMPIAVVRVSLEKIPQ